MTSRALLCSLLFASLVALPASVFGSALESDLNKVYKDKQLTLRQPDAAEEIVFDAQGSRVGSLVAGTWYENFRFLCTGVKVSHDKAVIKGKRLLFIYDPQEKRFVDRLLDRKVQVKVALNSPATEQQIQDSLLKVFMHSHETVADFAPDYWENCLRGEIKNGICVWNGFNPQLPKAAPDPSMTDTAQPPIPSGMRLTPPKAIESPDPQYTKLALNSKYEGKSVLWVKIDPDGTPQQIRIWRPAGLGLDEKAVEAVRTWKFKPATKDGKPVPALVNIEVNFRLEKN